MAHIARRRTAQPTFELSAPIPCRPRMLLRRADVRAHIPSADLQFVRHELYEPPVTAVELDRVPYPEVALFRAWPGCCSEGSLGLCPSRALDHLLDSNLPDSLYVCPHGFREPGSRPGCRPKNALYGVELPTLIMQLPAKMHSVSSLSLSMATPSWASWELERCHWSLSMAPRRSI